MNSNKIKHQKQLDNTGCGVACISMVSGISYLKVRDLLTDHSIFYRKYYLSNKRLRMGFEVFGIRLSEKKRFTEWNAILKTSIVAVNFSDERSGYHWVLFVRMNSREFFIYDPALPGVKKKQMKREKKSYYFEII